MAEMKEPRPASFFRLNIGGAENAALFRECSGIGFEVNVIETTTRGGNQEGPNFIRKVPGNWKYTNIVLKKGVDPGRELYDWFNKVVTGGVNSARVDGTIEVLDNNDGSPIQVYQFKQGWPMKWEGPAINAQSNEMAVESITIAHEHLERVQ